MVGRSAAEKEPGDQRERREGKERRQRRQRWQNKKQVMGNKRADQN